MKPPPFSYHDPKTVSEVVGLLSTLENAKLLAGGQSLMPMLNFRFVQPDHIIDLNRVEGLAYIRDTADGMEVGAMTRQRDLEFSDLVARKFPLMHEAIQNIGHRQTRNRGTIGGSLCHLDPSAELVSCAMTLDATVVIAGPKGQREIKFAEFPGGLSHLRGGARRGPHRHPIYRVAGQARLCLLEFSRRHGDFAIVSAAVLLTVDGAGKITRAAVTLGGMGTAPVRASELERRSSARRRTPRSCARPARAAAASRRWTTCTRRRPTASISPP